MKSRLTFLALLLSLAHLWAQEFEFPLYFEDTFGEKDTIFFGYDMEATTGIDEAFGEANIKGTPLVGLDVRIINYSYDDLDCLFTNEMIDFSTFHSKRQISIGSCLTPSYPALAFIIEQDRFPIKIFWDKDIFPVSCGVGPFLTDWHPRGWFAPYCDNSQELVFMSTIDSVIFETTSLWMHTNEGDVVNYFFFNMLSTVVDTKDLNQTENISIFPNPTTNRIQVSVEGTFDVLLYDVTGKPLLHEKNNYQNIEMSLNEYPDGIYLIKIKKENRLVTKRIVKQ